VTPKITPDILLTAYQKGFFPMAESLDSADLRWYNPPLRTHIPLAPFHLPKRLRRTLRQHPFHITLNKDFMGVIKSCAAPTASRPSTWINQTIVDLYAALYQQGHAHSLEVYEGTNLVGGLYGVAVGKIFCGESMFSKTTNASKIALTYLAALLMTNDYVWLDAQFMNEHLRQFGATEIPAEMYFDQLKDYGAGHFPLVAPKNWVDLVAAL
jgi:leucyl/phenylalanyl-tRNA---protein transferase